MQNSKKPRIVIARNLDEYRCWNCPNGIATGDYTVDYRELGITMIVRFCTKCNLLNLSLDSAQRSDYAKSLVDRWNSPKIKKAYQDMPDELKSAHEEACKSFVNGCYRAAALLCRTMIARVAIDKGSKKKYNFCKHVEHLKTHNLISVAGGKHLDKIVELVGDLAHKPIAIIEYGARVTILLMDMVLKDIYYTPDKENMDLQHWVCMIIRFAVVKMCRNDAVKADILAAILNDTSIFGELISEMYKCSACLTTAQELMDKKPAFDTLAFRGILEGESGAGVDCMAYLTSSQELKELLAAYGN